MNEQPPFPDAFEFLKQMWGAMGLPVQGIVAPILNVDEIDKRIADLKSVEQWLNMNLNVLRMSISGLQMQRATVVAFQAMQRSVPPSQDADMPTPNAPPASAADIWWNLLQQVQSAATPKSEEEPK